MKRILLLLSLMIITFASAQTENEPSKAFPYGQPHPDAQEQIKDYEPLMGECYCKSTSGKQDGTWNTPVDMVWK